MPDTYYLYGDQVSQVWRYVAGGPTSVRNDRVGFHVILVPEADPINQQRTDADCLAPLNATADQREQSMTKRVALRDQINALTAALPTEIVSGPPVGWEPAPMVIPPAPPAPEPDPPAPEPQAVPTYPEMPLPEPPQHMEPPETTSAAGEGGVSELTITPIPLSGRGSRRSWSSRPRRSTG